MFSKYHRNSSGSTPLHLAAATGHKEVVSYLLGQRGAEQVKMALDEDGKSPLAVCLECKMNDWRETEQVLREAYKRPVCCKKNLFVVVACLTVDKSVCLQTH